MSFQRLVPGLVILAAFASGCEGGFQPVGPVPYVYPTPTPGPQVLWDQGKSGNLLGSAVTVGSKSGASSTVSCADSVNGETLGLQVSNDVTFTGGPPRDAYSYADGYVRFDVKLASATASGLTVYWNDTLDGGIYAFCPVTVPGINASTFTHVWVSLADSYILGAIFHNLNQVEIQCLGSTYVFCAVELSEDY